MKTIAPNTPFRDRHFRLSNCLFAKKTGLPQKKDSPAGGGGAIVLFFATEFADQHSYENNWQSD